MSKVVLLDGAVGTSLWLKAEKRGIEKKPVWKYNIENPDMVYELCKDYIGVGCQMILANSFGCNEPAIKRVDPKADADIVMREAMKIVNDAVKGTDVKTIMSVGPLSVLLEPYGDLTEEECEAIYEKQIGAGMKEGADVIWLQTFFDLEMMKIAVKVAKRYGVKVFSSLTFEKVGKTIMGNSVETYCNEMESFELDGIGLNCTITPNDALDVVKEFKKYTKTPVLYKPNAGKPILNADGTSCATEDAKTFAFECAKALPYVDYIGGCCGVAPEYIAELKKLMD